LKGDIDFLERIGDFLEIRGGDFLERGGEANFFEG